MRTTLLVAAVAMLAACGDANETTGGAAADGGDGADAAGGAGGAGAMEASYQLLISGDWELEPYSEKVAEHYTLTLGRDVLVRAFRPLSPQGTHHTLLKLSNLGVSQMLWGAGVGTNTLELPPGVAVELPAGTTLVLELHVFNPSGEALSGRSGVEILEADPNEVEHTANLVLAGPLQLDLPPNAESTAVGICTVTAPQTLFALLPHMHQLGTHLKTTITRDGSARVLHDGAYDFEDQQVTLIEPIELEPGDQVVTECTFENMSSATVGWGESSNAEMCFSILYRYPAVNDGGVCAQ